MSVNKTADPITVEFCPAGDHQLENTGGVPARQEGLWRGGGLRNAPRSAARQLQLRAGTQARQLAVLGLARKGAQARVEVQKPTWWSDACSSGENANALLPISM